MSETPKENVHSAHGRPGIKPEHVARMHERREALRTEIGGIFPKEGRIVLEVGCGHGHFLTAYAQAHPERTCVGIDINLERVLRGKRKRERARLPNLHFVRAEAGLFLDVLPRPICFWEIFVLFPDPWPKKRHHKNRIMRSPFLETVARRSQAGTPLYFRTDYAPYFESVVEVLGDDPHWTTTVGAAWPFDFATIFQEKAECFQSLTAVRL